MVGPKEILSASKRRMVAKLSVFTHGQVGLLMQLASTFGHDQSTDEPNVSNKVASARPKVVL